MTTIFERSATCAYCGAKNDVLELGSTNAFGSMDLDMRPPPMQRDTLAQQIQRCQECGYCAPDIEKQVGRDGSLGSPDYQAILADGSYPDLARMYIAHASLAESSGDLVAAVSAHRNAAWACDDHEDRYADSSRKCRNEALRLMKALHLSGQSFTNDHVTDAILELDLLRRSGQYADALVRATALLDSALPEMLQTISAFQQRLAAAGDSSCCKVSDAMETLAGNR